MRINLIAHVHSDCCASIIAKNEYFYHCGKLFMVLEIGDSVKARSVCSGAIYFIDRDEVVSPIKFELKSPYYLN